MQSLLLTVTLFVLVAVLQAQDDLPFLSEEKKLSGVWFIKARVTERNLTELRRPMLRMTPFQEELLSRDGTTARSGAIRLVLGQIFCYIYELPVKDHYILYAENLSFEKKFQMGLLIGKYPKENLEALEEFKKFTQHKGLLQENMVVSVQRLLCNLVPFTSRALLVILIMGPSELQV
ncbi:vomeronasal secretory protein 2-like [Peromyscus californicus insignis]|uniref:vomeronasal secretory protein 2-like n=1 Tax=Peromyscus californicus insignis TaxID=564181 RepID=UPI0022A6FF50|nr:vomeronasal secretory protein 2-like [Peromyscus californicus insignis]